MTRFNRSFWCGIMASSLILLAPGSAAAQNLERRWEGYRDVHHRNDCRLAAQVLTHGQPANKRAWAMSAIEGCGPRGGEIIAGMFRQHRMAEERTPELEELTLMATRIIDRSIYEAAMEIAQDPSAGTVARVQAIRAVYFQITPGSFASYDDFIKDGPFSFSTYHTARGEPLPGNVYDEIETAMRKIQKEAGRPEPVATAAWFVEIAARSDRRFWEGTKM